MNMFLKTVARSTEATAGMRGVRRLAVAMGLLFATVCLSRASTVLEPWVPLFKGIDYAVGTNTPGSGGFAELQVVYILRVDLTDPDIRLFPSPRIPTNYSVNFRETQGYTATNFLKINNLQAAINANTFYLPGGASPPYNAQEGSAFSVSGQLISQGVLVSPQDNVGDSSALLFTSNNVATFISTNWPAVATNGVYTAVSGIYSVLANGVNVGSNYLGNPAFVHGLQPRTVFGLSQDRRYLLLMAIDGRQGSLDYSEGAYDWQSAAWLLRAGAWDGVNMDGGGSTCLVVQDTTGQPVPLNHDSASLVGPGFRERTVGCQFGVYASPLPGFFNDVTVLPDDTSATITWTTISPATTQLKYGTTTNMTLTTSSNAALVTTHSVLLTNLTPNTGYYFAALASIGANQYVSSNYFFVTTNYVQTEALFDLTNNWKYTTANLDGSSWTARAYNDSVWEGAGDGLLWVDNRGANGEIPVPLNTQMPEDFNSGNPFITYYFRTHFNYPNQVSGTELQFEGYVDDGAIFYLNGRELYRLRMPDVPAVINNATVATGFPCAGDATCPDDFAVSGPLVTTNLLAGDNVLAVEVHNYNTGSPDVTFGLAAVAVTPLAPRPTLNLAYANNTVTLSWNRGGFTLQQAATPTGVWTDVPGPVIASPFTTNATSSARFFRLRQ
jgi:hypothetical protein